MQKQLFALWKTSRSLQLYLVVGLLLLVIWGAIFLDLKRAHDETLAASQNDLTNLSLAFSKEIESSIKTIDVTLIDLREHWQRDAGEFAVAVHHRQEYLEKELAFQVAVTDAAGILVYSSLEMPSGRVDLSDREHFAVHKNRATDELFISKPVLGRVSKRWSIQFTRPMYDLRGRFAGVLVLSVSPEYFYRFYRAIRLPDESAITLVRRDGELLARYPHPEGALGKKLSPLPFPASGPEEAGSYQRVSMVDGIERQYSWRRVERGNLVVVLGYSLREIMETYREQRSRALLAGAGLTVLLLLVGYLQLLSIRQRQQEERHLAENEERWRVALESVGDGVWDWNLANNQVTFSLGWKTMLGYRSDEIADSMDEWERRVHPEDLPAALRDIQEHLEGQRPIYANEHRMQCKDGRWKWILDRGMVISRGPDGEPRRMVGTHTDISEMKEIEQKLKDLATTDPLTGLCNRRSFLEQLNAGIARVRRYPGTSAAVLMADIDFFKKINDTLGHEAGDAALQHFAAVLRSAVRESDVPGRLGGEEFAVLLPETSLENAGLLARRLCAMLRTSPCSYRGHAIVMTVSIGVATIGEADGGPEDVLGRADRALYEAKSAGRDRVVLDAGLPAAVS